MQRALDIPCGPVEVIVMGRRVLVHDGETYGEGETVQLPLEEVEQLEEHGIVTRPSRAPRPAE